MTVFVANTNVIELQSLQNEIDQSYINNASVDVTIADLSGNPETGAGWPSWPLAMVYVTASNGVYRAVLVDTLPFDPSQSYLALVHANASGIGIGRWQFKFRPQQRKLSEN
jgi:hypothetical protein